MGKELLSPQAAKAGREVGVGHMMMRTLMKTQGMRDGGLDKLLEKRDLRVAGEG